MLANNVLLLRKDNGNGTSKDWAAAAVPASNGLVLTVWFGRSGRPLQIRAIPLGRWRQALITDEIRHRYREKEREGYVAIGDCGIEDDGTVRMSGNRSVDDQIPASQPASEPKKVVYFEIQRNRERIAVVDEFLRVVRELLPKVGGTLQGDGVSFTLTIGSWSVALDQRLKAAGMVKPEHGACPLLFLMTLKKSVPDGVTVNLARDDGIEVSNRLLSEKDVLVWFGKTVEEVAGLAERLGLVVSIVDRAKVANEPDFYF